jgi:hypothetical protein
MIIPIRLKEVLIVAMILFFIIVLHLLKNKRLALKYTLLWLLTGVVLLLLAIFPQLLVWFAELVGVQSGMNMLYIVLIAFILMIIMSLTSIVSGQTDRIRKLAEANALLEERIRGLENECRKPDRDIHTKGEEPSESIASHDNL